ncbi:MAG TPA: thiamine-phosphate kinase [Gammaproteobacteria bacterium]|nr:thiamine-phosphate kinase [Gammaproteobacteria bacterium]
MTVSEFDIIERYFRRQAVQRDDVVLGIGDDAAVLQVPADRQLVVAMDTLVAGRHFPPQTAAFDIGWKALAVNLSDLAAMGARPTWATLSLTLPAVDEDWLEGFASGFFQLAGQYQVALVGGDTTRGPLSVTVQVHGLVASGKALRRAGARAGQRLFVTGTLGDAACALQALSAGHSVAPDRLRRLNRPEPRVEFGLVLAETGAAVIDISDGLLADLGHLLDASHCGATVWIDRLPAAPGGEAGTPPGVLDCQLQGGDDYELCFSVDAGQVETLTRSARRLQVPLTEIGVIETQPGIRCRHEDGSLYTPSGTGFDHFRDVAND